MGLRGQSAEAERLVQQGQEAVERMPLLLVAGMAFARGIALLGEGRAGEGFDLLEQLMVPPDPAYPLREYLGGLGYLTEAAMALDRVEDVRGKATSFGVLVNSDPALAQRPGEALTLAVLADTDEAFVSALAA